MESIESTLFAHSDSVSVSDFITACLYHPTMGYYQVKNPFGTAGDFVTSPQISSIFGELIALYFTYNLSSRYNPQQHSRRIIVDFGAGNGFLARDIIRTMRRAYPEHQQVEYHLLEISTTLLEAQKQLLAQYVEDGLRIVWHTDLTTMLNGFVQDGQQNFLMFVANEFLDAFPINQYVKSKEGIWQQIFVSLTRMGLTFTVGKGDCSGQIKSYLAIKGQNASDAKPGSIIEISPQGLLAFNKITKTLALNEGNAIFIDYGHVSHIMTSTLKGLKNHQEVDPLSFLGKCDITHLIDFHMLYEMATLSGLYTYPTITQGQFLKSLGIEERTKMAIEAEANPEKKEAIRLASQRLTSDNQMGKLFKVLLAESTPKQSR